MKTLKKISEGIYLCKNQINSHEVVELIENCSKTYLFEKVDRRPHLTMEFPTFFNKSDCLNSINLRNFIYRHILPPIVEYCNINNLSQMYPKKNFITVSKLYPGMPMAPHLDNTRSESNHFICMMYINDEYTGGEISFPKNLISYKPKSGDIVLYRANILHSVQEVLDGVRYSIGYGLTDDIID